jgi:hypothetical protein
MSCWYIVYARDANIFWEPMQRGARNSIHNELLWSMAESLSGFEVAEKLICFRGPAAVVSLTHHIEDNA